MMRGKTFYVPALAAVLAFSLYGCTVFSWGGGAKKSEPSPEPQAGDTFKQGEELLAKGKYDQARQVYSKVKENDPERTYEPLVQIRLGDSYYEEGRFAEAEVEYKRFLELHPQNKAAPYAKYQMAMCNFKQMDRTDRDPSFAVNAMTQFEQLMKDYPNNPYEEEAKEKLRLARGKVAEGEYLVGMYYYKAGAYKAAVNRFKGLMEKYPGSKDEPDALYWLADSYIRLGEYDNAKNTLAILYKEHPNHRLTAKAQKKLAVKIPTKPGE